MIKNLLFSISRTAGELISMVIACLPEEVNPFYKRPQANLCMLYLVQVR
jgi:hypothetical protein